MNKRRRYKAKRRPMTRLRLNHSGVYGRVSAIVFAFDFETGASRWVHLATVA